MSVGIASYTQYGPGTTLVSTFTTYCGMPQVSHDENCGIPTGMVELALENVCYKDGNLGSET